MRKEQVKNVIREFTMWTIFFSLFTVPLHLAWENYDAMKAEEDLKAIEYIINVHKEKKKYLPAPIQTEPFYEYLTA